MELTKTARPRLEPTHPSSNADFADAVLSGLSLKQKSIPCRFLYDRRGSELFEEITDLPEYYQTRAEIEILKTNASDIVVNVADGAALVEFGSGSSRKTELIIEALAELRLYIPIDVSTSALDGARERLSRTFPTLTVSPIVADFSQPVRYPAAVSSVPKFGFFPGSTIGNLAPAEAIHLLRVLKSSLSEHSRLIVGVDLKKDIGKLVRAYNDAAGVTAEFNLNLLQRINREIEHSINITTFRHQAIYDPIHGRIEMHLFSLVDQDIKILGRSFPMRQGESIHTENSYKYTVDEFRQLAAKSGWEAVQTWTDSQHLFSVHELVAA